MVPLTFEDTQFFTNYYIVPISGPEIVLAIKMAQTLGPMLTDYSKLTMQLT